jgi:G3E family GTPase
VATVIKPFQQVHTDVDILVTVFADAGLLPAMIQGSRLFADSVNYIYKKQLDEADVLVINKIDLLEGKQLEALKQMVEKNYSGKIILYQNSLKSEDIEHWLSVLRGFQTNARESLTLDYELYGAGEAELAWLDAEVEISAIENNAFDSGAELIKSIYSRISEDQLPIGHLKFLISDGEHHRKISFTSINKPDFTWKGPVFAGKVKLIINARVQTRPDHLREIVSDSIREVEMKTSSKVFEKEMSSFTPGYPRPTHRILD